MTNGPNPFASHCGTVFKDDAEAKIKAKIAKLKALAKDNPNFHEGIAANIKAAELEASLTLSEWEREKEIVNQVEAMAKRWYAMADAFIDVVNKCRKRKSARGIDEMVAYTFNATQYEPSYAGGGGLPPGKHPVTITKTEARPTKDNTGGMIVFTLTAFDGPAKGSSMEDRLNVHNTSPKAVEIANKQLAAYCAVVGVPTFQNTDELCGKPFIVEVAQQANSQYVEVVNIFDMNGNEPAKAGSGPMTGGAANGGFPNGGGGFPGGGQGGGGFPPQDQQQQQPNTGQGGGTAWGQGNTGQPPADQQQANGGAWAGNTGGGQPPAGGNAWGQGQGNGGGQPSGGQPGWGQR